MGVFGKNDDLVKIWPKLKLELKIGTTFTKMVLGSPNMAKNQLWVISNKMLEVEFEFRSDFSFSGSK